MWTPLWPWRPESGAGWRRLHAAPPPCTTCGKHTYHEGQRRHFRAWAAGRGGDGEQRELLRRGIAVEARRWGRSGQRPPEQGRPGSTTDSALQAGAWGARGAWSGSPQVLSPAATVDFSCPGSAEAGSSCVGNVAGVRAFRHSGVWDMEGSGVCVRKRSSLLHVCNLNLCEGARPCSRKRRKSQG